VTESKFLYDARLGIDREVDTVVEGTFDSGSTARAGNRSRACGSGQDLCVRIQLNIVGTSGLCVTRYPSTSRRYSPGSNFGPPWQEVQRVVLLAAFSDRRVGGLG
jgi:hypothetical protein